MTQSPAESEAIVEPGMRAAFRTGASCRGLRLLLLLAALTLLAVPTAARAEVGLGGPGPQYPTGTVDELERPSALREFLGFSVYSKWDPAL